ncbi:MAG: M28 family peptidase [Bacteroidia bacterium]
MRKLLLAIFICISVPFSAQTNIISTNPLAEQVMLGNYNPATYQASTIRNSPDSISRGILAEISPDSLKSYIISLASFGNRNSGSDTVSSTFGIGASRRWIYQKFSEFSAANENRLLPSYLQFDELICTSAQHRNIFAVLPGLDTSDKRIIIIEAHMDSRCEGLCDSLCIAQGVEDNATGTALVLELARVMSKYSFNHTIVFVAMMAEEQGLYGAEAFADYTLQKGILIKAVQNNDVIGGIICGQTSSPPSCPGNGNIDSIGVRLFSFGAYNSFHKGYSRFIKLEYKEMINPYTVVHTDIRIMSPEDRTGRGGDHIPFRQHGYPSMRFTSANEHGDANVTSTSYNDRQHSYRDTLGMDTDNDQVIDSFFVDFNYLARNAVINGNAAAMAAIGPKTPDFLLTVSDSDLIIHVTQQTQFNVYRVGVRTLSNDWDSVYTFTGMLDDTIDVPPATNYYVSICSVDTNGIESVFSREYTTTPVGITEYQQLNPGITLLQNRPNPFDEATYMIFQVDKIPAYKKASMRITDLSGKIVREIPVDLQQGINEVLYEHGYGASGILLYSLVVDGRVISTKEMIFAN